MKNIFEYFKNSFLSCVPRLDEIWSILVDGNYPYPW